MQRQTQKVIGINISDSFIRAAYLSSTKEKIVTNSAQEIALPRGIVNQGVIQDPERVISLLSKLLTSMEIDDIKSTTVVFGLPESQTYSYVLEEKENNEEKDPEEYIKSQVELLVPESSKDIIWRYKRLASNQEDTKKHEFLLAVTKKETLKQYENIVTRLGVRDVFFDNPLLAISQIFVGSNHSDKSQTIVSIEPGQTSVVVISNNRLRTVYTIPIGENNIIGKLMDTFNLTYKQAKEKIPQINLANQTENLNNIFKQEFQIVLEDIENTLTILFRKQGIRINEIVLLGETSKITGLIEYIENYFGISTTNHTPDLLSSQKIGIGYVKPVALALNLLKSDPKKRYLLFKLEDTNSNKDATNSNDKDDDIKKMSRVTTKANIMVEKSQVDGNKVRKKLRLQKTILISIVMIGLILVPWLIQSRNKAREERRQEVESLLVSYDKTQDITVTAAVATNPDSYSPNYIRGIVISNSMPASGTLYEATLKSKRQAEAATEEGQALWKEPLSINSNEGSAPFDFSWLSYLQEDQKRIFVKELDEINSNSIPYSVNSFNITEVTPTEDPFLYTVKGTVNVSLGEYIPVPENNEDI